jgi:hypothetical protein
MLSAASRTSVRDAQTGRSNQIVGLALQSTDPKSLLAPTALAAGDEPVAVRGRISRRASQSARNNRSHTAKTVATRNHRLEVDAHATIRFTLQSAPIRSNRFLEPSVSDGSKHVHNPNLATDTAIGKGVRYFATRFRAGSGKAVGR